MKSVVLTVLLCLSIFSETMTMSVPTAEKDVKQSDAEARDEIGYSNYERDICDICRGDPLCPCLSE